MDNLVTYTASDARDNLYTLLRSAAKGLNSYEINLRGNKPVILISKEELEGWLETLDVMSSPEEVAAIEEGCRSKKTVSHNQLKKMLGI